MKLPGEREKQVQTEFLEDIRHVGGLFVVWSAVTIAA